MRRRPVAFEHAQAAKGAVGSRVRVVESQCPAEGFTRGVEQTSRRVETQLGERHAGASQPNIAPRFVGCIGAPLLKAGQCLADFLLGPAEQMTSPAFFVESGLGWQGGVPNVSPALGTPSGGCVEGRNITTPWKINDNRVARAVCLVGDAEFRAQAVRFDANDVISGRVE